MNMNDRPESSQLSDAYVKELVENLAQINRWACKAKVEVAKDPHLKPMLVISTLAQANSQNWTCELEKCKCDSLSWPFYKTSVKGQFEEFKLRYSRYCSYSKDLKVLQRVSKDAARITTKVYIEKGANLFNALRASEKLRSAKRSFTTIIRNLLAIMVIKQENLEGQLDSEDVRRCLPTQSSSIQLGDEVSILIAKPIATLPLKDLEAAVVPPNLQFTGMEQIHGHLRRGHESYKELINLLPKEQRSEPQVVETDEGLCAAVINAHLSTLNPAHKEIEPTTIQAGL